MNTPIAQRHLKISSHIAPACGLTIPCLQRLAVRARAEGLLLVAIAADGGIAFCDPHQSSFFARYALPYLLRQPAISGGESNHLRISMMAGIPGTLAATFVLVERNRVLGRIVLVGRSERFTFNDEVVRICQEQVIDEGWLARIANSIPPSNAAALMNQARLIRQQQQLRAA